MAPQLPGPAENSGAWTQHRLLTLRNLWFCFDFDFRWKVWNPVFSWGNMLFKPELSTAPLF